MYMKADQKFQLGSGDFEKLFLRRSQTTRRLIDAERRGQYLYEGSDPSKWRYAKVKILYSEFHRKPVQFFQQWNNTMLLLRFPHDKSSCAILDSLPAYRQSVWPVALRVAMELQ